MSDSLLRADHITRTLPGPQPVKLIDDITLDIKPGEFVAITGPSGSGKSSLLYLLGLLDRPSMGEIYLKGTATSKLDGEDLARLRLENMGFVFQFHFLLPEFTTLDNIMMPMRKLQKLPEAECRARAEQLLKDFDLAGHGHKFPGQLSGGMRQRVAIARAIANNPPLILADEPTGNLDTKNSRIVFDIFEDLVKTQQRTVIMVTHSEELAAKAGKRVHIVDGKAA